MRYLKSINEFFTTSESLNPNTLDYKINQFEGNIKRLIKSDDYRQDDLIDYFEDIKSILESDCSEFINELKNSGNHLLYRGIKRLNVPVVENEKTLDGFYEKQSRKNRYTLDIDPSISESFDDYFQQKFDIRLRSNGVFATKDPLVASGYSQYDSKIKSKKAFMFFPIGSDYLYFWNPNIWDLFSDIESENWYYRAGLDEDDLYYEYSDDYGDPRQYIANIVDGYQEGNLNKIKEQEITFITDKYYILDEKYYFLVKDWLFN